MRGPASLQQKQLSALVSAVVPGWWGSKGGGLSWVCGLVIAHTCCCNRCGRVPGLLPLGFLASDNMNLVYVCVGRGAGRASGPSTACTEF